MAAEEARAAVWAGTEELLWAMSMEHPTATPMECWLEPMKVSSSDRLTVCPMATRKGPLKACSKVPPTGKPKVLATEQTTVRPRATRRGPLKACSKVPQTGKPKVLVTEQTTVPWKAGQMGSSTAELMGTQKVLPRVSPMDLLKEPPTELRTGFRTAAQTGFRTAAQTELQTGFRTAAQTE